MRTMCLGDRQPKGFRPAERPVCEPKPKHSCLPHAPVQQGARQRAAPPEMDGPSLISHDAMLPFTSTLTPRDYNRAKNIGPI